jgi:hypothetical protein
MNTTPNRGRIEITPFLKVGFCLIYSSLNILHLSPDISSPPVSSLLPADKLFLYRLIILTFLLLTPQLRPVSFVL